jgi:hypothetical protein
MVKATYEDRKTNTRRIEGLKILNEHPERWTFLGWTEGKAVFVNATGYPVHIKPRYQVGGELYVREHWWAVEVLGQGIGNQFVVFDDEFAQVPEGGRAPKPKELRPTDKLWSWGPHPSIHLPKKHSRLWLRVTAVKDPHRIQTIGRADAKEEGFWPGADGLEHACGRKFGNAELAFTALWNRLHPKSGERWEDNPWHFTYEIKRIER